MRLIDADALWTEMQKNYTDGDCADEDRLNLGINLGITKSYNCLSNMPTIEARPTDGDLISRSDEYKRGFEDCRRAYEIEIARRPEPSARPTGEWRIDEYGIYHCPFCYAINNTVYKSFCPNCGADMRGED